ncbi:MAG: hypothetical protein AAFY72_03050 [Cyanobacteria bacterium J06649_4]
MNLPLVTAIVAGVQILGVLNAAHAIMNVRSPQSAIAWSLSQLGQTGSSQRWMANYK